MAPNLEPAANDRLLARAAPNGRSMRAKLRLVMDTVLAPKQELDLAEVIRRRVAEFDGGDIDPPPSLRLAPAGLFEP